MKTIIILYACLALHSFTTAMDKAEPSHRPHPNKKTDMPLSGISDESHIYIRVSHSLILSGALTHGKRPAFPGSHGYASILTHGGFFNAPLQPDDVNYVLTPYHEISSDGKYICFITRPGMKGLEAVVEQPVEESQAVGTMRFNYMGRSRYYVFEGRLESSQVTRPTWLKS